MSEAKNNDSWVKDATYQQVAKDLKKLSHKMKNEVKATKAHNLAQKIASFSEKSPAPEKVQHQITNFVRKSEMYAAKQRNQAKGQSMGL